MHLPNKHITFTLLSSLLLVLSCRNKSSNPTQSSNKQTITDSLLVQQGKTSFREHCNTCHAIQKTENLLAGIVDRIGSSYLKLFITRQDSLIDAKDKYALELKKVFNSSKNLHNYRFSDEQLNAIIAYLKKYSPLLFILPPHIL